MDEIIKTLPKGNPRLNQNQFGDSDADNQSNPNVISNDPMLELQRLRASSSRPIYESVDTLQCNWFMRLFYRCNSISGRINHFYNFGAPNISNSKAKSKGDPETKGEPDIETDEDYDNSSGRRILKPQNWLQVDNCADNLSHFYRCVYWRASGVKDWKRRVREEISMRAAAKSEYSSDGGNDDGKGVMEARRLQMSLAQLEAEIRANSSDSGVVGSSSNEDEIGGVQIKVIRLASSNPESNLNLNEQPQSPSSSIIETESLPATHDTNLISSSSSSSSSWPWKRRTTPLTDWPMSEEKLIVLDDAYNIHSDIMNIRNVESIKI